MKKEINTVDLLAFLKYECSGYENRKSGSEIVQRLKARGFECDYKQISALAIKLHDNKRPVYNKGGYFYATPKDLEFLVQRLQKNATRHDDINNDNNIIKELLKDVSLNEQLEYLRD